jgi:uncharacterized membrane protein
MSQIEMMVVIERPVEQVFDYLSDLRNMTGWAKGIVEAKQMTPGGVGSGTVYRIAGLLAGRRLASAIKIMQYEPRRMYTSVSAIGPVIFDDRWEFTAKGESTQVRQVSEIYASGLLAPLGVLAAKLLGKRIADDLRRAKHLLEATVPPQQ